MEELELIYTREDSSALAEALVDFLQSQEYQVTSRLAPMPGLQASARATIGSVHLDFDVIAIFLGSGVATALLNNVSTDIYNTLKKWLGKKKEKEHPEIRYFIMLKIYDSGTNELRSLVITPKYEVVDGDEPEG